MKSKRSSTVRLSSKYHRPLRPVRLRRRSRWWRWVVATSIGVLLVLGWTWKGVYVDALRIKKARLSIQLEELQGQQKHLQSKLVNVRSFRRIDSLAKTELNMVYANRPPRILPVPGYETDRAKIVEPHIDTESLASLK